MKFLRSFGIMDYSLLVGIHNISEEMRTTTGSGLLPILSNSNVIEDETRTISKDSGITIGEPSNLPTYTQYVRVIEFIRAQQEYLNVNEEQTETTSLQTIRPVNQPTPSNNAFIGGDLWLNRQNLSRLAMFVQSERIIFVVRCFSSFSELEFQQ